MKPSPMRPRMAQRHQQPRWRCPGRCVTISANEVASSARPMLTSRCVGWRSASRPTSRIVTASAKPAGSRMVPTYDGESPRRQLHVHRQQVGRSEQRRAVDEGHHAAHRETAVAEQARGPSAAAPPPAFSRRCQAMKATNATRRRQQQQGRRPAPPPCSSTSPLSRHRVPALPSSRPRQSRPAAALGRRAAGRGDGHELKASHSEARQNGTTMKKIERQPNQSTSSAADARADRRRQHHAHAEDAAGAALLAGLEGAQDDDRGDRLHHARGQAFGHPRRQHQRKVVARAAGDAAGHQQQHGARHRCGGSRSAPAARAW